MTEREALERIAESLYNRNITSYDTWDEIHGILSAVGHGRPLPWDVTA